MTRPIRQALLPLLWLALMLWPATAVAETAPIRLASTTSTQNSGLLDYLLPIFTHETGIEVQVIAVGTGRAFRIARAGDADLLMVHHPPSEAAFVAAGYGVDRRPFMYNDFVVLGPVADPASVAAAESAVEAFAAIARARRRFVSRGDDSGTHRVERGLWRAAGIATDPQSGKWYWEVGAGMGATLNITVGTGAYTLSDRATWLAFANKGRHGILFQGGDPLQNQYSVIQIDAARHPHIRSREARRLANWLQSSPGQRAISAFRIGGRQVFFANAAAGAK